MPRTEAGQRMRTLARIGPLAVALAVSSTACTYAPAEERAHAKQIVRLGDSYRAAVVVRRDAFRRPTGLAAFPDGGSWRFLQREFAVVLVDARSRRAEVLHRQDAPDALWQAFDAHVTGVEQDSALYVNLTGCPRVRGCDDGTTDAALFRLDLDGSWQRVPERPDGTHLPGRMISRARGERNYVRFTTSRDTILARTEEGTPYRPLFRVLPDGALVVVDAGRDGGADASENR